MHILLTGCNGYIGSHVAKTLKENGHIITGWDINIHGEYNDVSNYLDFFQMVDVRNYIPETEYDCVVHLAGLATVERSMSIPYEYYQTNIYGTNNILRNIKTNHIIFASTSSAWEMASPYARSKVAAEDIIKQLSKDYTIFRFFNVSGTNGVFRQLGPATHLIRVAAEVAAGKRSKLTVYGDDYDTRDGTCIRDYVHVEDLARAIAEAVSQGPARTPYECIGSNKGWSVLEVVDTMKKVSEVDFEVVIGPRRPGDAISSVVDQLSDRVSLTHTIEDMCLSQYLLEKSRQTSK
jgi:UDP-glucose 4-epimerase